MEDGVICVAVAVQVSFFETLVDSKGHPLLVDLHFIGSKTQVGGDALFGIIHMGDVVIDVAVAVAVYREGDFDRLTSNEGFDQ